MKLLTLTVTDVENVNAEYDFATGNVGNPEDAIRFLGYALFGNEVVFSGKITLKVETGDEVFVRVERDFAGGVAVYRNDELLDADYAEATIAGIAGLKRHQWEENVRTVDSEEVLADISSFVKKHLAEMGLDGEELEKRWHIYLEDRSRYASKVEAFDELVDDSFIKIAADKKQKMEELQQKLAEVEGTKKSADEKALVISLKKGLSEKKRELIEKESEIAAKRAKLDENAALLQKINKLSEISESKKESDEAYAELDAAVTEMEALQSEIFALEKALEEKNAEIRDNSERAAGLMESFGDILQSNLDDKELTNAVLMKTEGVVASVATEAAAGGLVAELQATHNDFKKQRAIREGVAFENSFESSELRIADLEAKIKQNVALMESIEAEISDAENMLTLNAPKARGAAPAAKPAPEVKVEEKQEYAAAEEAAAPEATELSAANIENAEEKAEAPVEEEVASVKATELEESTIAVGKANFAMETEEGEAKEESAAEVAAAEETEQAAEEEEAETVEKEEEVEAAAEEKPQNFAVENKVENEEENKEEAQQAPTVIPLGTRLPCDSKSLDVYEAKVVARNLEKEIAKEEAKIRELLKVRKTQIEDCVALKKAKIAQEEYVRRCEKKKAKYDEKLLVARSRIAFNGNKGGMEIGDACPVCNSRLVNKPYVEDELERLGEGYRKLSIEAEENAELLKEAQKKLADINIRLTRINERIAMGVTNVNGLTDSVNEKRAKLSALLAEKGVKTVADLERKYRALPLVVSGDGVAIQEHINFLQTELMSIAATVEADRRSLAEEKERLAAMKADYEEAIKPELGGKLALETLEEIIESDKKEDILIAEMNGEIPVGATTMSVGNGNAEIYVNVTAEIFANVMDEIKKSEDDRSEAEKESEEIRAALDEKRLELAAKVNTADEIKEKADNLAASLPAALEAADCTAEDLDRTEELKAGLLSEEEESEIAAEVEQYDKDLQAVEIQLSALEGHGEDVEFDDGDYTELKEAAEKAEKAYRKVATRLAVSEAAKDLAIEKASMCDLLTDKMDAIKKLTDGEIFEVVIPVMNDVLATAGAELEVVPDGDAIDFVSDGKAVKRHGVDEDVKRILVDCALNYVMSLASGVDTVRFAVISDKDGALKASAEKYGVIVL